MAKEKIKEGIETLRKVELRETEKKSACVWGVGGGVNTGKKKETRAEYNVIF